MAGTRGGPLRRTESGSDFGGFIAFMTGLYGDLGEQAVDSSEKAAD